MNTSTKHNFFCTKRLGIALKWSDWLNQHLCEFRDLRKFKTFAIYLQEEKTVTSNISPFGQKLRDTRLLIDKEKKKIYRLYVERVAVNGMVSSIYIHFLYTVLTLLDFIMLMTRNLFAPLILLFVLTHLTSMIMICTVILPVSIFPMSHVIVMSFIM